MTLQIFTEPGTARVYIVYTAPVRLLGDDYHLPVHVWEWSVN